MMESHGVPDLAEFLRALGRPQWYSEAACKGQPVELFFPVRGESAQPAKEICSSCPVKEPCADYAAGTQVAGQPIHGVWGGMSARERRRAKRDVA
jgi:WhiB family transcriptional regulator, redox-sensing transcriptional regulator